MKAYMIAVIANSQVSNESFQEEKKIWHTGSDASDVTGSSNSGLFRIIRGDTMHEQTKTSPTELHQQEKYTKSLIDGKCFM